MLHTVLFRVEPVHIRDSIVIYIDLETTNLCVVSGKIVEIGALIEGSLSTFSTVVIPGQYIEQSSVHGIPHESSYWGRALPKLSRGSVNLCDMFR